MMKSTLSIWIVYLIMILATKAVWIILRKKRREYSRVALRNYFAIVVTAPRAPYLAYQPTFYSSGTNQRWELLAYGNNGSPTSEMENDITS